MGKFRGAQGVEGRGRDNNFEEGDGDDDDDDGDGDDDDDDVYKFLQADSWESVNLQVVGLGPQHLDLQ
eukprot:10175915-Karenia_brevis.AAC.1